VNKEICVDIHRRLRDAVRGKRPRQDEKSTVVLFRHDSDPAHW